MKKFIRALALAVVLVMAFGMTACTTYTKNGSVIQDVKFDVSYTEDGETKNINATLSLYKTFAPQTCDRVIELVNSGFYNGTSLVLSKQQDYLVVGGYDFIDEDYVQKSYNGSALKGEFTSAGRESKLRVQAGSLVMLRDFDTASGGAKYDTAKASFAIVLGETTTFDKDKFCVFGLMDSESVTLLQQALIDNAMYDGKYMRVRYAGDRNEDGVLNTEGKFDYYYDGTDYFNLVNGEYEEMVRANETDPDYDKYQKITNYDSAQDIYVLPKTVFKVKTELCKGQNKK